MTERYGHIADKSVEAAAERIGNVLGSIGESEGGE